MKKVILKFWLILSFLVFSKFSYCMHPLITDDTGTQGKGHVEIEIGFESENDKEEGVKARTDEIAVTLSYGILDNADLVFSIPYQFVKEKENGVETLDEDGISDISFELKYRFFEKEKISFALKPSFTVPTGDEEKGLGTGKITYSLYFIGTKEFERTILHFNLGYIRNENKLDERENIYHLSVACELPVSEKLTIVGDIAGETNTDKEDDTPVLVGILGFVYSLKENLNFDIGIKFGLNEDSPDWSILSGITMTF